MIKELYHRTRLENLDDILTDGFLKSPSWYDRSVPICFSEEYKNKKTTWGFVSFVFEFKKIRHLVKKTLYHEPTKGEEFYWLLSECPRVAYKRLEWEREWYSYVPVPIYLACEIVFFRRHPMGFVILHRKRLDRILKEQEAKLASFRILIDEKP